MSDLTDKLRQWADMAERQRSGAAPVDYVLLRGAANEIARLSAENVALHATVAQLTRVGTHCENERQGSCRGFKAVE